MKSQQIEDALTQIAAFDPVLALCEEHFPRFAVRSSVEIEASSAPSRSGNVAVIPIHGALLPRGGRGFFSSATGMDNLRAQIRAAANDGDISAIVLDVDSPGGTVAGTMETAAEVKLAASRKPVVAVANTLAASAAYWIASQASQLVMAPSADVGSIGAMVMHVDISKALDDLGVKITMMRSAPFKNEATPFSPLTDEAKTFYQERVDEAGADFVKAVAEGRRTSQANVRERFGQGRVYGAREALARGMVDRVATLDDVISGLIQKPSARMPRRRSALSFV